MLSVGVGAVVMPVVFVLASDHMIAVIFGHKKKANMAKRIPKLAIFLVFVVVLVSVHEHVAWRTILEIIQIVVFLHPFGAFDAVSPRGRFTGALWQKNAIAGRFSARAANSIADAINTKRAEFSRHGENFFSLSPPKVNWRKYWEKFSLLCMSRGSASACLRRLLAPPACAACLRIT